MRMAVNILLETVIGAIPVIGDLFDFVFKANSRNLRLLQRYTESPSRVRRISIVWLLAFLLLTTTLIAGMVVLVVQFIQWLVALSS